MDSYTFALALGGAGLVAMAVTGVASSGHAGGGQPASHAVGHGHPAHHHQAGVRDTARLGGSRLSGMKSALLSLASPRVLFSVIFGYGVAGMIARPFIGGAILVLAAICGGVLFELALAAPAWRFVFRFASQPAASLEGSILSEATATSGFDANGQGLVAVEVDGQLVQCLGTLRADDRELGVHVRAGDMLRVEDVDPARSRCTVSYVRHGAAQ